MLCFWPSNAAALELNIEGVEGELHDILKTALILPASLREADNPGRRLIRAYQRRLPRLVRETLQPYGYFQPQSSSQLEAMDSDEPRLRLVVEPGPAAKIAVLDLNLSGPGAELAELKQKIADFPLRQGDILRQDLYEQGKAALLQQASDLGFLDAQFSEHQLLVHVGEQRATIKLSFATGPRYRFGETRFHGAENYPQRFLRRFLSYRREEPFSYRQLGKTRVNLVNADLFRSVDVQALNDQRSQGKVPIRIDLEPAPRHRLRPGIGYGTDTGARLSLQYHNLNLWQRGHELQGQLLLAERQQSLVSTYIMPAGKRLDSRTLISFGLDREETDSYISRQIFSEAEYQRTFGRGLSGSLFVRLTQEISEVGSEKTNSQLLLPGVRLTWKELDDPLQPQRGTRVQLQLQGAEESLLSDTSLLQLTARATHLQPLPWRSSLLLRLQGGTTWQDDPLNELPASLRYFTGGDRSVRGYKYQSLGPRDEQGEVVGGKHLLVGGVELEKRITDKWGAAIFYDAGNAFDNLANYELEQGAGIGLRYYTLIGAIRLDLARQLGNEGEHYRLHLNVGMGW
jgi:translocation and assembly module TamA